MALVVAASLHSRSKTKRNNNVALGSRVRTGLSARGFQGHPTSECKISQNYLTWFHNALKSRFVGL